MALHTPALGVLLEPAAQARPLAQERLVCDLDRRIADCQQAAVGERLEHRPEVLHLLALEVRHLHPPADRHTTGSLAGEAQ